MHSRKADSHILEHCKVHSKEDRVEALQVTLLLKASVAPGAWFLSGWNFKASFL